MTALAGWSDATSEQPESAVDLVVGTRFLATAAGGAFGLSEVGFAMCCKDVAVPIVQLGLASYLGGAGYLGESQDVLVVRWSWWCCPLAPVRFVFRVRGQA